MTERFPTDRFPIIAMKVAPPLLRDCELHTCAGASDELNTNVKSIQYIYTVYKCMWVYLCVHFHACNTNGVRKSITRFSYYRFWCSYPPEASVSHTTDSDVLIHLRAPKALHVSHTIDSDVLIHLRTTKASVSHTIDSDVLIHLHSSALVHTSLCVLVRAGLHCSVNDVVHIFVRYLQPFSNFLHRIVYLFLNLSSSCLQSLNYHCKDLVKMSSSPTTVVPKSNWIRIRNRSCPRPKWPVCLTATFNMVALETKWFYSDAIKSYLTTIDVKRGNNV